MGTRIHLEVTVFDQQTGTYLSQHVDELPLREHGSHELENLIPDTHDRAELCAEDLRSWLDERAADDPLPDGILAACERWLHLVEHIDTMRWPGGYMPDSTANPFLAISIY